MSDIQKLRREMKAASRIKEREAGRLIGKAIDRKSGV